MELENLVPHDTMCSGMAYSGTASFSGKTVHEVLEEIKQFVKGKPAHYIGEGFGNKESNSNNHWGIYIKYRFGNWGDYISKRYVGNWAGWQNEYDHEYDNYIVTKVEVDGGWYCYYDFTINCIEPDKEYKQS